MRRGVPDILGVLPPSGRLLAFEVKTLSGKLSKEQQAFIDDINAAGGFAAVVRSLDDLQEKIKQVRGDGR